jgi:preprotein translocase SecE subunit
VVFKSKKNKVEKSDSPKQTSGLKSVFIKIAQPLVGLGGYFKGSWEELKQVRWPNRKATWGLTLAVILYSMFFVVMVILLDAAFKLLFELILK